MTQMNKTASQLGLILGLIGSIIFTIETGFGETWNIIVGNDVTADTAAHFTGGIDFVDRLTVTLMFTTILVGLGVVGVSRSNPDAVNQILKYSPWLGMAIGLTAFSSEVVDIVTGEFDFATVSDAAGAMYVAVTGWVMSGVAAFLTMRK
jgi:hypothetical protein